MRVGVLVLIAAMGCGRIGFGGSARDDATADDADGDGATGDASSDGAAPTNFSVADAALPNGAAPSARRATGAATAPDERIWIFGGFAGAAGVQNNVGAYTPNSTGWTFFTPAAPPSARERHALAWDTGNQRLVVFAGYQGTFPSFVTLDELWVYAPATSAWTQIPKAGTWPAARKDAVMTYAPSLNALLLYGGNNGSGAANRFSDIWKLSINTTTNTATWTLLAPSGTPPAQSAPCAAYDPAGRRWILYGGEPTDGNDASTTYQFLVDSSTWQLDTTTGASPGGRSFSACAWDAAYGRVVLYGGQSSGNPVGGAFQYDPTAKKWTMLAASGGTVPGNLSDAGASYSPMLGGMFVFGGRKATTTYTNESMLVKLVPQ